MKYNWIFINSIYLGLMLEFIDLSNKQVRRTQRYRKLYLHSDLLSINISQCKVSLDRNRNSHIYISY